MATALELADQKVEFELGSQRYCIDIRYITEVSKTENITPIPNSAPHLQGMMDLRGRTTSIIDPKVLLNVEEAGNQESVLVFDSAEVAGDEGWIVDGVNQVIDVTEDEINDPPGEADGAIRGIIRRDGEFIMWIDPDDIST